MKNNTSKVCAAAALVLSYANSPFAKPSATALTSAATIGRITIAKDMDMPSSAISATLNVTTRRASGTYTNATGMPVTVNYN